MFFCPQEHVDNCKKKPVECPNSCGEIIAREEVQWTCTSVSQCYTCIHSLSCELHRNCRIGKIELGTH